MVSMIRNVIGMLLAGIFALLGVIGLALPVIPQVPFFVISVLLAASCSRKFKSYLVNSKLYREYAADFVRKHRFLAAVFDPPAETEQV